LALLPIYCFEPVAFPGFGCSPQIPAGDKIILTSQAGLMRELGM
jgi:hypothetical protein